MGSSTLLSNDPSCLHKWYSAFTSRSPTDPETTHTANTLPPGIANPSHCKTVPALQCKRQLHVILRNMFSFFLYCFFPYRKGSRGYSLEAWLGPPLQVAGSVRAQYIKLHTCSRVYKNKPKAAENTFTVMVFKRSMCGYSAQNKRIQNEIFPQDMVSQHSRVFPCSTGSERTTKYTRNRRISA